MLTPADEIKAKLDIVEVIRQYVPVKAAGANFLARCPFHNEKTPSFTISPTKQVWHCFGCGKGGDLFSFIMEIEKLTFVEALRLLAPKAGVVLQRENGPLASKRNQLLDILDHAAAYYHRLLLVEPSAQSARAYLKGRGLDEETVKRWQIGYAPDSWDDLLIFLRQKSFSENDIMLAGLAVQSERGRGFYNRFRGRIMFPIREVNGNVVGFSARILPEFEARENQGKYINTPQSMVYDKSRILFGLDKAKQSIREQDIALVVEGQLDCITAHSAGFTNVIATSGTAFTEEQVTLLKRYSNRAAFALDMDKAGRAALDRATEQALAAEMEALIITLPDGKDPDECIRRDPEGWKQAVHDARPVLEYYLEEAVTGLDISDVSGRRAAVQKFLPRLMRVRNLVEKDFWLKRLCQAVDMDESMLHEMLARLETTTVSSPASTQSAPAARPAQNRDELLSEQLLSLLLKYPDMAASLPSRLSADEVAGTSNQALYRGMIVYYNKNIAHTSGVGTETPLNYQALRSWLLEQRQAQASDIQALDRLALLVEKNFFDTSFEQAESAASAIIKQLRQLYIGRRLKVVTRLIAELDGQGSGRDTEQESRLNELLKEFNDLAEEIRQLSA